ncbi:DUF4214 domain-containing protein [Variovorax sp. GB1P17]|uniref:DUF4214 domain-containing protein n=1 Tax=Variovorax sp. GB1P17 TaxID=3443740 RepID=UPI003F463CC3
MSNSTPDLFVRTYDDRNGNYQTFPGYLARYSDGTPIIDLTSAMGFNVNYLGAAPSYYSTSFSWSNPILINNALVLPSSDYLSQVAAAGSRYGSYMNSMAESNAAGDVDGASGSALLAARELAAFAPHFGSFDSQYQDISFTSGGHFIPAFTDAGNDGVGVFFGAAHQENPSITLQNALELFGSANAMLGGKDTSAPFGNSVHGFFAISQGYDIGLAMQRNPDGTFTIPNPANNASGIFGSTNGLVPLVAVVVPPMPNVAAVSIGSSLFGEGSLPFSSAPEAFGSNTQHDWLNFNPTFPDSSYLQPGFGYTQPDVGWAFPNFGSTPVIDPGYAPFNPTLLEPGFNFQPGLAFPLPNYDLPLPEFTPPTIPNVPFPEPCFGGLFPDVGDFDLNEPFFGPVVLNLDGKGLNLDTLSSSTQFVDTNSSGYEHRTAWAAAGNGVLALDLYGDGQIHQKNQYAFTEWDPTSTSDLQALKDVFDTNHNGRIDAGDASWSQFKVMVNGQMVSLDSLGITSIDLTPTGSGQTFGDGSAFTGTTSYTKSDGTKGQVGDAVLATDGNGYLIHQTQTTNAGGSVTTDIVGSNADGSKAFENVSTLSANGLTKTINYDDNGDGIFDRSQSIITGTNADGSFAQTISNLNADGSLKSRTATTTSADTSTVSTQVDQNGDGVWDQSQVFVRNANGSTSTTTKNLTVNGAVINQTQVTTSADGLIKTTKVDSTGSGTFDQIKTSVTAVNADGSRVETVTDTSSNGTVLDRTVTNTSADARSKTVSLDHTGAGNFDLVTTSSITVNTDKSVTTVVQDRNADGSLRDASTTTLSADGRSKTVSTDLNGDGSIDQLSSDVTVIGSDGSRIETITSKSGNGTLLSQTVTTTSADKKTITTTVDANGDGAVGQTKTILVNADGSTTTTVSTLAPNGSLVKRTLTTASASGLSTTSKTDSNGDGTYDLVTTDTIVTNADGSRTETVTDTSANGTLIDKSITTTSANGLTQSKGLDLNGDGTIDQTTTDAIVLNADGSRTETVSMVSGTGALLSKVISTTSADRKTTTQTTDSNGDGHIDETQVGVLASDGSTTRTVTDTSANGSLQTRSVSTTNANGLSTTTQSDATGDGVFDGRATDVTVLNTDGSKTETRSHLSGNGTLLSKTIVSTSGNGLAITTQKDANGDGVFDGRTTDVVTLNADGSRTETVSDFNGDGTKLIDRTITLTAANGLSKTVSKDVNGDGTIDSISSDVTKLSADGSKTETRSDYSANGTLLDQTITTTSADGKRIVKQSSDFGANGFQSTDTITVGADGRRTEVSSTYTPDGSVLRSSTTAVTSADGLTTTTQTDLNGDGTVDQSTSSAKNLNADGSKTATFTEFNSNGSLKDKVVTTTSANGLSVTTQMDATGTGTFSRTTTDIRTINADGSTTEVVSELNANGSLHNRTTTTISADKKTTVVGIDINGDGVLDQMTTVTVNPDGSKVTVDADLQADGITGKDQRITTTSANGLTKSTVWGNNSSDATRQSEIYRLYEAILGRIPYSQDIQKGILALAAGTTTAAIASGLINSDEFRQKYGSPSDAQFVTLLYQNALGRSPDAGGLASWSGSLQGGGLDARASVAAGIADSEEGRRHTAFPEMNWAQAYAATTGANSHEDFDRVVIDANGAATENLIIENLSLPYAQDAPAVVITSADGLTVTKLFSRDSATRSTTAITAQSTHTVTNPDGTKVTTTSSLSGNVTLAQQIITSVSADGLTKKTETLTNIGGLGAAHDAAIGEIVHFYHVLLDRFPSSSEIQRFLGTAGTLQSYGDIAQALLTSAEFQQTHRTLSDQAFLDMFAAHIPSWQEPDLQDINMTDRASVAAEVLYSMSDDLSLRNTELTWALTNLDVTLATHAVADDITVLNADGSTTRSVTDTVSGTLIAKSVTTTSADGLTVITQRDTNGSGSFDQTQTTSKQVLSDGSSVVTVSKLNAAGSLLEKTITATSTDGRVVTVTRDANGDGVVDQTETIVKAVDGSSSDASVDFNASGAQMDRVTSTTGFDGRTTTTSFDYNADGINDETRTVSRTFNANGSTSVTTQDFRASQIGANGTLVAISPTLQRSSTTTVSADGRNTITTTDVNGDSAIDQTVTSTTAIDGSTTTTVTNNDLARAAVLAAGTVAWISSLTTVNSTVPASSVTTVSADGLTRNIKADYLGNGSYQHQENWSKQIDNSWIGTITDRNASGIVTAKGTETISADGRTTTLKEDSHNTGLIDHTDVSIASINGSVTETVTDLNADGSLKSSSVTTIDPTGSHRHTVRNDGSYTDVFSNGGVGLDGAPPAQGQTNSLRDYDSQGHLKLARDDFSDGTSIEELFDTTNTNTWATSKTWLNAQGQQVRQAVHNHDGSNVTASLMHSKKYQYDGSVDYGAVWRQDDYDAQNRHVSQRDTFIDGSHTEQVFDADNTKTWSHVFTSFNAQGQQTWQQILNDDGSYADVYPAGQAPTLQVASDGTLLYIFQLDKPTTTGPGSLGVVSTAQFIDPQGRLTGSRDNYADGSYRQVSLDVTNAQTWSTLTAWFNANQQLTREEISNRDGTRVDIFPTGQYAATGTGNSSAIKTQVKYDAQGRQMGAIDYFADGTHSETQWDTAGTQHWSSVITWFDAQGQQTRQQVQNDDGTHSDVTYTLNSQSQQTHETISNQDGSHSEIISQGGVVDIGTSTPAIAVWIQQNFNAQGTLISERDNLVDGTHVDVLHGVSYMGLPAIVYQYYSQLGLPTKYLVGYPGTKRPEEQYSGVFNGLAPVETPVVLDLANKGAREMLSPLSSSSPTFDMAGDGQQHHTAWASAGEGVLAIDADGTGKLDQQKDIVFTEWESGATSDMQALRDVFDTNHDGKLDAGDARWKDFRVLVDGKIETLDQLGIVSIGLTPQGETVHLSDGSSVNGTSLFTRTDGSTGLAGDAAFRYDPAAASGVSEWAIPGEAPAAADLSGKSTDAGSSASGVQIQAATQLNQLIGAMASFAPPASAQTALTAANDPQLQTAPLLAAAH